MHCWNKLRLVCIHLDVGNFQQNARQFAIGSAKNSIVHTLRYRLNWRQFLIVPPLAAGVAVFMWMTRERDGELPVAQNEEALAVRVVEVSKVPLRFFVTGFGRVEAAHTWSAISQVQGRAVYVNPKISVGHLVDKDEQLVIIDPRNYEISLAKARTARDAAQASLAELEARRVNILATLELEERIEAFLQTELERQSELLERGNVAQSIVDQATRSLLTQQKIVLEHQNNLNLIPVQRKTLETTLAIRNAEIEEATRNLENAQIHAPFAGRVSREAVALGQFIRVGDNLFTIDSIDTAEIVAEFQPQALRNLLITIMGGNVDVLSLFPGELNEAFDFVKSLNLQTTVHSTNFDGYTWPAELIRFGGSVDEQTGAVGLVVQVDAPTVPDPVTQRPPLVNGTFVEIHLSAPEDIQAISIERNALHADSDGSEFVYVVDEGSRLARRGVIAGTVLNDKIVILNGLADGDTVVLSDPQPVVYGMLLQAMHN